MTTVEMLWFLDRGYKVQRDDWEDEFLYLFEDGYKCIHNSQDEEYEFCYYDLKSEWYVIRDDTFDFDKAYELMQSHRRVTRLQWINDGEFKTTYDGVLLYSIGIDDVGSEVFIDDDSYECVLKAEDLNANDWFIVEED